jgi:hypothetical protein
MRLVRGWGYVVNDLVVSFTVFSLLPTVWGDRGSGR